MDLLKQWSVCLNTSIGHGIFVKENARSIRNLSDQISVKTRVIKPDKFNQKSIILRLSVSKELIQLFLNRK